MTQSDDAVVVRSENTVERLAAQLSDPKTRRVLVEALSIGSLMGGCTIDRNYTVPDTLAAPIRLTELGKETLEELRTKAARHKPNDLKFALFLEFGCPAGILVDASTDIPALRAGLTTELSKQKVLFPYIFGRDLHDLSAARYPEKNELSLDQTVSLLKDLPVGVFQEGYTTTGPFGCIESFAPRMLSSSLHVPGYYCSDETCEEVHTITLNTADAPPKIAPANKTLRFVGEHLVHKYGRKDDPHARLISEAGNTELNAYKIDASEALVETIADGLSPDELRAVADKVLKEALKAHGPKSLSLRLGSVINNPTSFVASLSTPHLIQLLLIFPDEFLLRAVDSCVAVGTLPISDYEVRIRRINRFSSSARTWAEIGSRGGRVTGSGAFVAGRLMEMLRCIYFDGDSGDLAPEDLAYLIGPSASQVEEGYLLDYAARVGSPEKLLRDFVLGSRKAVEKASDYLHVSLEGLDREEMLQTLLWKLGASSISLQDDLDKVSKYETELMSSVTSGATQDATRGHISNLFAALEGALRVSLEFCTWTLTNDHFIDELAFVYDPMPKPGVLAFIEKNAPAAEERFRLELNGKNALSALGAGFARLAKAMQSLNPGDFHRPIEQVPAICRDTQHPFAFPHTIPFFDLSAASRERVLKSLNTISRLVQDEVVLKVRNATIHGDTDFPSATELRLGAEKVAQLRGLLSETGFYPTLFKRTESTVDELGRTTYRFDSGDAHILLHKPSWAVAPKMPYSAKSMIAVPACDTMASGPLRFSLHGRVGDEPYWAGWPKRWNVKREYGVPSHEVQGRFPQDAVG